MSEQAATDSGTLARTIHLRLRELEAGGREIEVTRGMEAILLNDASYVPRHRRVRPKTEPGIRDVEEAARVLRTTVSALVGERPHPPVYAGPPSSAEDARRRIHREGGGSPTPFTVLVFPPGGGTRAVALVAELPMAQTCGDTEDEALEALREALDVLLTRAYEATITKLGTRGREVTLAPFGFQPPGAGRTR